MRFEPTLFVSVFFICHVAPEDNEEGKKGQLLSWGTRQQTRRKNSLKWTGLKLPFEKTEQGTNEKWGLR